MDPFTMQDKRCLTAKAIWEKYGSVDTILPIIWKNWKRIILQPFAQVLISISNTLSILDTLSLI
jgi:hypothetical protein